jgi:hypothetical protein
METSSSANENEPNDPVDDVGEDAEEDADRPPVHYSTGRLTEAQAETVNRWRARLLENRPLPGRPRKDPMLSIIGIDNRPPASCSDIIAAAVLDMLDRQPPDELALARYAAHARDAQRADAERAEARFPPVSFYLPAELADHYDELRQRAYDRVLQIHIKVKAEAAERYPDPTQAAERALWVAGELAARGVPMRLHRIPGGAIARMAIDRWRRRSVDRVAAAAVDYAEEVHVQPHRARQDMHKLRR